MLTPIEVGAQGADTRFIVTNLAGGKAKALYEDLYCRRLIKIAARVVEMKTQIRLHLPTSCPDQRILRIVLDRIPRFAT